MSTETNEHKLYAEGNDDIKCDKMVKVDSVKKPKLLVSYESEDGKRDNRRRSTPFLP